MFRKERGNLGKQDEKKDAKSPEKKKKPALFRFFGRIRRWMRETKGELKKVQWPTFKQTLKHTWVVLVSVVLVGVFIWIFDAVAHQVIAALLSLSGKG